MPTYSQRMLEAVAKRAAARSTDPTRHKCFVSYHQEDEDEAESFIDKYGDVFIAKVLGVSDEDDFIDSDNTGLRHTPNPRALPHRFDSDHRSRRQVHLGPQVR